VMVKNFLQAEKVVDVRRVAVGEAVGWQAAVGWHAAICLHAVRAAPFVRSQS
jgi:hypothetical protein